MCIIQWVGDGWCDNGIVYHVDCTQCEHFTDADGVFDGGDCDEEARTSIMVKATKSLEKAVGRSRLSKQAIKAYMSKMAKTRKSAEKAVAQTSSVCMSHDDCSGETPFCYSGHCDSCQECHFCHDGIDGTCGSCGDGFPTQEDGPCGEAHEGGQFCMSHSDCSGDAPFCYEHHCDVCEECHFCHDGIDGTCGPCGAGFPTMEDGPCGESHGQFCMSHSDCQGDTPFCYEYHCNSCAECHFCHDGVDGTCGSCGDGFPTLEDGPCEVGGCPEYCIDEWIGDDICDMYDCDACDHFTAGGVFDGGDCELGGGNEGGDFCMSHSDCSGDTPFCFAGQCDSCQECHYCLDGVDGTCGPCGDGFPLYENTCETDGDCPSMCIIQWVGDGWC
eukprot:UN20607